MLYTDVHCEYRIVYVLLLHSTLSYRAPFMQNCHVCICDVFIQVQCFCFTCTCTSCMGDLNSASWVAWYIAQSVCRASAYNAEGRGFESHPKQWFFFERLLPWDLICMPLVCLWIKCLSTYLVHGVLCCYCYFGSIIAMAALLCNKRILGAL